MNGLIIVGALLSCLLTVSSSAPMEFEKQILYSFQDPSEFELIAPRSLEKRAVLNLIGNNRHFINWHRQRPSKKFDIHA